MAGLVFFDINILLYAISSAPSERIKRDRARELLESFEVGTSLQVIQDFHVNATGKLKKTVQAREISGLIDWLVRQPLIETDAALFREAVLLQAVIRFLIGMRLSWRQRSAWRLSHSSRKICSMDKSSVM